MTYNDSIVLAKRLKELSPGILGIELFGGVAKKGYGRDADFLVLVHEGLVREWWAKERKRIKVRFPDFLYGQRWVIKELMPFLHTIAATRPRRKRLETAADILGIQFKDVSDSDGKIPDFEMFLVPSEWRTGAEVNWDVMQRITDLTEHRNTVGFLERIARDVLKII